MKQIITPAWEAYELLKTGDGERIERFGEYVLSRPEQTALWGLVGSTPKTAATFQSGEWRMHKEIDFWNIKWRDITFTLKLTPFRHVGIFPEQASNWEWLQEKVKVAGASGKKVRVLNLFGYTGGASIAAALAGAEVCHVDASKGAVHWASENARASEVPNDRIRWIVEDARKFVAREVRRGSVYDVVLLDPPVFGRGNQGEVWRLEEDLRPLLQDISRLFSKEPVAFLLNFYATEVYPESIARMVREVIPQFTLDLAELCLAESDGENILQTGYLLRS